MVRGAGFAWHRRRRAPAALRRPDRRPAGHVRLGAVRRGVAGLYCVATAPDARGNGAGTAITLAALDDARRRGYRTAVPGAEAPAVSLYRRLGFRRRGLMTIWASG
ncbi:MAG TPA: GNAT family N-acetyltransferase [Pilimelia sp.]|nr:GNAT family N-acetyltransferase [Pilimelia sp.]